MIQQFSFPTTIEFGRDSSKCLAEKIKASGRCRPLLLCDRPLKDLPFFVEIKNHLEKEFAIGFFYDFSGNPTEIDVLQAAKAYETHNADSVIAVGGGAVIDVAKATLVVVSQEGDLFDYVDGSNKPILATPFFIALPTTAGTGSEVGRCTVISNSKTHEKKLICSPNLLPDLVIADPQLTFGLPPKVTAATGMDALTHALEAYLVKEYHPMCDAIALETVGIIHNGALLKAFREPENFNARRDMLMAASMGAVAFQKGLGLTHSLAHALSAVCDLHHGLANSLMLEVVLNFNQSACEQKFQRLNNLLNENCIEWVHNLRANLQLPLSLQEVGVKKEQLPRLVEFAMSDFCRPSNPRPSTAEDLLNLYREAF